MDSGTTTATTATEQLSIASPTPGRRWTDLGLILTLAFVPSIAASVYYLSHAQVVQFTTIRVLGAGFQELSFLTLFGVLYFRQGRKLSELGLGFKWLEVPKGVALFLAAIACYWLSYSLHLFGHASLYSPRSAGMFAATSLWVLIPFLSVNPLFEETLVRGYLMTEIIELRSSKLAAVLLSVAIQTSYHLHYGVSDALCLGVGLAVFAVYYAKSRRLMPVIFAHWLWDLTGLIGAWHR